MPEDIHWWPIDDTISDVQDPNGLISVTISTVQSALDATGGLQAIEARVSAFADGIPWLMKGLDEVARIHPVVTGECSACIILPVEI